MPKQLNDEVVANYKKVGLLPKDRLEVVVNTPKLDSAMQLIAIAIGENRKLLYEMNKPKPQPKTKEWEFNIARDLDGNISKIVARQIG